MLSGGKRQRLAQRLLIAVFAGQMRYPQGSGPALQGHSQSGRLEHELGAVLPLVHQGAGPPSRRDDERGKALAAQAGRGTVLAHHVCDRLPHRLRRRYAEQIGGRLIPQHDLLVLVDEDHREPGRARDGIDVNRVPDPPRDHDPGLVSAAATWRVRPLHRRSRHICPVRADPRSLASQINDFPPSCNAANKASAGACSRDDEPVQGF